jgi:hypothetical protein
MPASAISPIARMPLSKLKVVFGLGNDDAPREVVGACLRNQQDQRLASLRSAPDPPLLGQFWTLGIWDGQHEVHFGATRADRGQLFRCRSTGSAVSRGRIGCR